MPEEPSGIQIRQLTRAEVPAGTTITPFSGAPSETLRFALEPILPPAITPPGVPSVPREPLPIPPTLPPTAPPAEPTIPLPIPVPIYTDVPVDISAFEYKGVVWARDKAEAELLALRMFGEPEGLYVADEYKDSPTAWFILHAPSELIPRKETEGSSHTGPTDKPPATSTGNPTIITATKEVQCPSCKAGVVMQSGSPQVECPICKAIVSA